MSKDTSQPRQISHEPTGKYEWEVKWMKAVDHIRELKKEIAYLRAKLQCEDEDYRPRAITKAEMAGISDEWDQSNDGNLQLADRGASPHRWIKGRGLK